MTQWSPAHCVRFGVPIRDCVRGLEFVKGMCRTFIGQKATLVLGQFYKTDPAAV